MRLPAIFLSSLALVAAILWPPAPALALDCRPEAEAELHRLELDAEAIAGIRYVQKHNPAEKGPDILGVRAWVRLKACSGHLVIDMTRSCFVRQSYTRGDCRVEGATAY